jgi:hypothetical protein
MIVTAFMGLLRIAQNGLNTKQQQQNKQQNKYNINILIAQENDGLREEEHYKKVIYDYKLNFTLNRDK